MLKCLLLGLKQTFGPSSAMTQSPNDDCNAWARLPGVRYDSLTVRASARLAAHRIMLESIAETWETISNSLTEIA
jgi:hypothetical protein